MDARYPHLFSPLSVGNYLLKNRIIFGPVQISAIDGNNHVTDYGIDFFAARARGGAAMVCVGDTPVDSRYAPNSHRYIDLNDPGALPMLGELVDSIHEAGALAAIELNHAGGMSQPAFLKGSQPIGPSEIHRPDGVTIQKMGEDLLSYTLESFRRAAAFAKLAGFDCCTICAGDGWLLHQFLSGSTNHRTDRYGGSPENRMRFPLQIIREIRKQVGPGMLLMLRLCAAEELPNGITLQDAQSFAQAAEPFVDLIQVTAGTTTTSPGAAKTSPLFLFPHSFYASLAKEIRSSVHIPVAAVSGIMNAGEGETLLANGTADVVSMCRALIADPDLPAKSVHGNTPVQPCIRCLQCMSEMSRTKLFRCTVNPECGREFRLALHPVKPAQRRIVVVGGGIGGMTAALAAARRGCQVTLFEQASHLGGRVNAAQALEYYQDLLAYRDYLIRLTEQHPNIRVLTGVCATPETVTAQYADGIIVAIGASPAVNQTVLNRYPNTITADALYTQPVSPSGTAVVIGGGIAGCDAALYLRRQGWNVTLAERRRIC